MIRPTDPRPLDPFYEEIGVSTRTADVGPCITIAWLGDSKSVVAWMGEDINVHLE